VPNDEPAPEGEEAAGTEISIAVEEALHTRAKREYRQIKMRLAGLNPGLTTVTGVTELTSAPPVDEDENGSAKSFQEKVTTLTLSLSLSPAITSSYPRMLS
jgi:hypothetical protein